MELLATLYEKDIYPDRKSSDTPVYEDRIVGKAILRNAEGLIALVGNRQNDFFQLPGGGVEVSEEIEEGIVRECLEETGYPIQLLGEVGIVEDYRPRDQKHCISYCYFAEVAGDKSLPQRTDNEVTIGMYTKWASFPEVRKIFEVQKEKLSQGEVGFYNTGYNIFRDYLFFQRAFPELLNRRTSGSSPRNGTLDK